MTDRIYPRDLIGYGDNLPQASWPDAKRLALQFELNYEEGRESYILHGNQESAAFLSEAINTTKHLDGGVKQNTRFWNTPR